MSAGTLLFSSSDLSNVAIVEDLSDFWSSADVRGDLPTSPGVDGAFGIQRPVSAQVRSGQVTVTGEDLAETEAAVAAVKAILRQGLPQTVTRRKITSTGTLDATQVAITRNVAERWITDKACTLLISVETLDGPWLGSSANIASAAGTHAILGDLSTRHITLTLAAGAARTITNTSNGYWLTFSTTVPSGGVEVDVEARTAIALTGSVDYSRYLSWGKLHPFQLDPGANTITVSAVSASIDYQPAYL